MASSLAWGSDYQTSTVAPPPPAEARVHAAADRPFIYDLPGLETRLLRAGLDLERTEVLSTDFQSGISAPDRAVREYRDTKWRQLFGRSTLVATRQRLADAEVVQRAQANHLPGKVRQTDLREICVQVEADTRGDLALHTWDDSLRLRVGEADALARSRSPSLFFVEGDERAALTHLAPGESALLVEINGDVRGKPKRRIAVKRAQGTLVVTEQAGEQTVCMHF